MLKAEPLLGFLYHLLILVEHLSGLLGQAIANEALPRKTMKKTQKTQNKTKLGQAVANGKKPLSRQIGHNAGPTHHLALAATVIVNKGVGE